MWRPRGKGREVLDEAGHGEVKSRGVLRQMNGTHARTQCETHGIPYTGCNVMGDFLCRC